jgi:hypothetical protein
MTQYVLDKTNAYSWMHVEEIHENNVGLILLKLLFTCGLIWWKCCKTQEKID